MSRKDYVKIDLAGYPFNWKYPPNYEINGTMYHGYKDAVEETFFYDFAVQGYDLRFLYQDKWYFFMSDDEYVALTDDNFTYEYQRFEDGNAVLEQFCINGIRLLDILHDIDYCEPV